MVNEISISQSIIKAYQEYLKGEMCGVLFEKQYLTKEVEGEPTAAMKLGQFFEYQCTGALPKSGVVPEPEKTQKGELTAEYKRASKQALNFHNYIKKLGIKIQSVGKRVTMKGVEGTLDIEAEFNGEDVVIDLKLSGNLNDKWNDYGWELESLPYKEKIMIQAVHYTFLTAKPFYFWVFSSGNDEDCKLIKVNVDTEVIKSHYQTIEKTRDMILLDMDLGFKAYPELTRCRACPLFDKCEHKTEVPIIQEVYYSN